MRLLLQLLAVSMLAASAAYEDSHKFNNVVQIAPETYQISGIDYAASSTTT
jgi:hypothetical protein